MSRVQIFKGNEIEPVLDTIVDTTANIRNPNEDVTLSLTMAGREINVSWLGSCSSGGVSFGPSIERLKGTWGISRTGHNGQKCGF